MKKVLSLLVVLSMLIIAVSGCSTPEGSPSSTSPDSSADTGTNTDTSVSTNPDSSAAANTETKPDSTTIKIGASITPHAEILNAAKDLLKAKGYELDIIEYTDYVIPNTALNDGDIDANYFQHKPYLDVFNQENNAKLFSMAGIHYEPYGLYPGKTKAIADLQDGAKILVPNDPSNEARALLLLEAAGLIKLKEGVGIKATKNDITENTKNLDIVELEAAQIPRSLQDVDMAVINGNYAIQAGFSVNKDALAKEDKDSIAAATYANIIAVREGDENRESLKALVEVLKSDEIKQFINDKYDGAVVPVD